MIVAVVAVLVLALAGTGALLSSEAGKRRAAELERDAWRGRTEELLERHVAGQGIDQAEMDLLRADLAACTDRAATVGRIKRRLGIASLVLGIALSGSCSSKARPAPLPPLPGEVRKMPEPLEMSIATGEAEGCPAQWAICLDDQNAALLEVYLGALQHYARQLSTSCATRQP